MAGEGRDDHQVLKFCPDGTLLLQIGHSGKTGGSNHEEFLGQPTDMEVDPETNEVFVADGYLNRRVIVFDADTGEYKRHWGAYGKEPVDFPPGVFYDADTLKFMRHGGAEGEEPVEAAVASYDPSAPPAQQFRIVHGLRIANDGLVYVADRSNNRLQIFRKDGTFVEEVVIARNTLGEGSTWDVDLSRDEEQRFLYNVDGTNQRIWILRREDLEIVGSIGRRGRNAGQFHWVHKLAVDSRGQHLHR